MNEYLEVPPPSNDTEATERPSILVVDDDETKRFTLSRLLTPLGCPVVQAHSGPTALRCLLGQDFAVILLDVRMPGMDGVETAALIRSRPRSHLTPILLTTASTRAEIAACGMYPDLDTDAIFAPVEPEDLRATVSAFVNLHLKAQELGARADAAQASAERWRRLTRTVPVGIFHIDRCHRYTYTNPRWSEITAISATAALGQDWSMIVDVEQASQFDAAVGAEAAGPAEISHRLEILVAGTDAKIVLLTSKPVLDAEGGITGWVGSLTDVSAVAREGLPQLSACHAVALAPRLLAAS